MTNHVIVFVMQYL